MFEVRCPTCKKLLFKVTGAGAMVEIVCGKCKSHVRFPSFTPEVIPPVREPIPQGHKPVGPTETKAAGDSDQPTQ